MINSRILSHKAIEQIRQEAKRREILKTQIQKTMSNEALAVKYNVSKKTIQRIINAKYE